VLVGHLAVGVTRSTLQAILTQHQLGDGGLKGADHKRCRFSRGGRTVVLNKKLNAGVKGVEKMSFHALHDV